MRRFVLYVKVWLLYSNNKSSLTATLLSLYENQNLVFRRSLTLHVSAIQAKLIIQISLLSWRHDCILIILSSFILAL
jgi:hypothetical protein